MQSKAELLSQVFLPIGGFRAVVMSVAEFRQDISAVRCKKEKKNNTEKMVKRMKVSGKRQPRVKCLKQQDNKEQRAQSQKEKVRKI